MSLPNIGVRPSSATPISNTPESKPPTPPLTSSLPSSTLQTMNKKKTGDAYDIDNIVIPYSMLASTRVEKLHYKEIDTPGWREVINGMLTDLSHHLDQCDSPLPQEEEGVRMSTPNFVFTCVLNLCKIKNWSIHFADICLPRMATLYFILSILNVCKIKD